MNADLDRLAKKARALGKLQALDMLNSTILEYIEMIEAEFDELKGGES